MRFSPSIGLVEHIAFKGFDIGTFIRLMSRMLEATSFRPLANERPRLDLFHLLRAFIIQNVHVLVKGKIVPGLRSSCKIDWGLNDLQTFLVLSLLILRVSNILSREERILVVAVRKLKEEGLERQGDLNRLNFVRVRS